MTFRNSFNIEAFYISLFHGEREREKKERVRERNSSIKIKQHYASIIKA